MFLIAVLKRKDASSVLVAVVIAMILVQFLSTVTSALAARLSGAGEGNYLGYAPPAAGFAGQYLYPLVWAVLQLLLLEVVVRLYVWAHASLTKK